MKPDLIIFGEDWGALPSSTQHLIRLIGQQRRVLWVNSIGLRQPRLSLSNGASDFKRILRKITRRFTRKPAPQAADARQQNVSQPALGDFHLLHPLTIPAPRSRWARAIAARLLQRQIRRKMQAINMVSPLLWMSLPTAVDMIGKLNECGVVYYCGDDFAALAGVDHDTVSQREAELVDKADLIFAASEVLANKFPRAKTHLLSHGVDYDLFSVPAPRAHDLPNDGRPIAGFYGSLSEWLDLDLICTAARQLPHWHFVFIGQPAIDLSAFKDYSNIHLLGPREHARLPEYSQHWSVSMLPFLDNAQIRACNPLKLREYLAAGRPIVSTPFPAAETYRAVIRISDNRSANSDQAVKSFIQSLEAAAASDANAEELRARVKAETWRARAQFAQQLIDDLNSDCRAKNEALTPAQVRAL